MKIKQEEIDAKVKELVEAGKSDVEILAEMDKFLDEITDEDNPEQLIQKQVPPGATTSPLKSAIMKKIKAEEKLNELEREQIIEEVAEAGFQAMSKVIDEYEEQNKMQFDFEEGDELEKIWVASIDKIKGKFGIEGKIKAEEEEGTEKKEQSAISKVQESLEECNQELFSAIRAMDELQEETGLTDAEDKAHKHIGEALEKIELAQTELED